jgi:hypothetical protein
VPAQLRAQLGRVRRREGLEHAPVRADHEQRAVDERAPAGRGGVELGAELAGRPEIVVVQEREPLGFGGLDACVQRPRLTAALPEPEQPDPGLAELRDPFGAAVVGAVVDDDDLDLDLLLPERARERVPREERPTVARGDDDRDLGFRERARGSKVTAGTPRSREPEKRPQNE